MKRILLSTLFLAAFGLALAGPPVDYQLYCEVTDSETSMTTFEPVGVASEVEGERHVMLADGALAGCDDVEGFVTVDGYPQGIDPTAEGAVASFFLTFDDTFTFVADEEPLFETTLDEVPQVAVDGKLGAMQNRAEAFQRAEAARTRAEERAGGPPMDVPGEGDDGETEDDVEIEDEEDGPPMELPEPAKRGRP